jgi:hypothetical protein
VQLNNINESISFRRYEHYPSPNTVEVERALEVHWAVQMLSLGPFVYKIRQGLGLDHHFIHLGYVEPHELECPFGDPSHGDTVPDNFSEPK